MAAGGRLVLQNITLADGKVAGNGDALLVQGAAERSDVTVRTNQAVGSDTTGGAILVDKGTLVGDNLRVLDSSATTSGGGINNWGGLLRLSNPAVELELERRDDANAHLRFRQLGTACPRRAASWSCTWPGPPSSASTASANS